MKKLALIVLLYFSACAYSDELMRSDDGLAHNLSTMNVLYESSGLPIVNVIQSWEEVSECSGPWQSCPNSRLFISSSMGDLHESPLRFELPTAKGWRVMQTTETENELVVSLLTTLPDTNVSAKSRKEWSLKKYNLQISKSDGTISLVK